MQKKRPGSDRSGDRFIHDAMSAFIAGPGNMKKDAVLDFGTKEHGSRHRSHFPHRSIPEMTLYLTWRDAIDGRKLDPVTNLKLATGHAVVDALPSKFKERLKLAQTLAGMFL